MKMSKDLSKILKDLKDREQVNIAFIKIPFLNLKK